MSTLTPQEQFGQIDIYLFDQILKGRIARGTCIVDAGCGEGRNIHYLLREGYEVFGADVDPEAIETVRSLARQLAPALPESHFQTGSVEDMPFDDGVADVVICNTVLHFARDDAHFETMLDGVWRLLKPGGLFFSRLGSTIGMESQMELIEGRRYKVPDGSTRYLVDADLLTAQAKRIGGQLADPLKTTVVQDLRAMTTWVLRKDDV